MPFRWDVIPSGRERCGMKKVISFSGGRTSAYLVYLFKDNPDAHFV
ncbi:hypothetical protein GE190_19130, partial [Acinetobacter baumannii]